ncbi:argonaute 1 [Quaeritorhiza haematococci]|nr:argonaute 1 [Quaeritorhiza haematococci]
MMQFRPLTPPESPDRAIGGHGCTDITIKGGIVRRPLRPDTGGRLGKPIQLLANFFEFKSLPKGFIYHYDVEIKPVLADNKQGETLVYQKKDRKVPKALISRVVQQWRKAPQAIEAGAVHDGNKNVFTVKKLPFGDSPVREFQVPVKEDDGQVKPFTVMVRLVSQIDMNQLQGFVDGTAKEAPYDAIMALDVILRHGPSLNHIAVGRSSFFPPTESTVLPNSIVLKQGWMQSARPGHKRMFLNIDVCNTTFYEPGPLTTVISNFLGRNINDLDFTRPNAEHDRRRLEKFLRGVRVEIRYGDGKIHRRPIKSISRKPAKDIIFFNAEQNREMSIVEYFRTQYNIELKLAHLPCVQSGGDPKKPIYYPIELLHVLPNQKYNLDLNEKQTAEVIRKACQKPDQRSRAIKDGFSMLQLPGPNPNDDMLKKYNISLSNSMTQISGRVLAPPKLAFSPQAKIKTFVPQNGAWNLIGYRAAQGAELAAWSVVVFGNDRQVPRGDIENFVKALADTLNSNGINVKNNRPVIDYAPPDPAKLPLIIKTACDKAYATSKQFTPQGITPQLVLCVFPQRSTLYGPIKKISDCDLGVATQCCVAAKFLSKPKGLLQYAANLGLKINAKLGGRNHILTKESTPWLFEKPTMVLGADVTHPPQNGNMPSIAAVVGSLDAFCSRYASQIRTQGPREEVIADLADMVKHCLEKFRAHNNGLFPSRILFFRDGVSEGQFPIVAQHELNAIMDASEEICGKANRPRPTVTFIIVQKRHHARFFPANRNDADRSGNTPAGTVVDSGVVNPTEFDFYLCSHRGLQGTSRPAHYHVLYDEHNFTSDSLETLVYHMCYSYARASCAVSYPPPPYYAHLLADKARHYRKSEGGESVIS